MNFQNFVQNRKRVKTERDSRFRFYTKSNIISDKNNRKQKRKHLFWLSGRAVDSGQAEREFKSPCLPFFFLFSCCTAVLLY